MHWSSLLPLFLIRCHRNLILGKQQGILARSDIKRHSHILIGAFALSFGPKLLDCLRSLQYKTRPSKTFPVTQSMSDKEQFSRNWSKIGRTLMTALRYDWQLSVDWPTPTWQLHSYFWGHWCLHKVVDGSKMHVKLRVLTLFVFHDRYVFIYQFFVGQSSGKYSFVAIMMSITPAK